MGPGDSIRPHRHYTLPVSSWDHAAIQLFHCQDSGELHDLHYSCLACLAQEQEGSLQIRSQEGQDVTIDNTTFHNRTVYALNYTLPGQSLLNGHTYFVSVQADSNGTYINATSEGVEVRSTT